MHLITKAIEGVRANTMPFLRQSSMEMNDRASMLDGNVVGRDNRRQYMDGRHVILMSKPMGFQICQRPDSDICWFIRDSSESERNQSFDKLEISVLSRDEE